MDPASIVEDAEQTWFCPQTDRRADWGTDWNTEKVKPVYPPSTSLRGGVGGIMLAYLTYAYVYSSRWPTLFIYMYVK